MPPVAGVVVDVSIRAPAWGATHLRAFVARLEAVSIRAPAWGATVALGFVRVGDAGFNSRSRMGSDSDLVFDSVAAQVSIRAPAWGATLELLREQVDGSVSIRAPAWGATQPRRHPLH